MKLMIIGVGKLGSQVAFVSMLRLRPEKIMLVGRRSMHGDILDLQHAAAGLNIKTVVTDKKEPADFIIITAGVANTPDFLDEKSLEPINKPILGKVDLEGCTKPGTSVVIMTNPVHEMTAYAKELWPGVKIINPESFLLKMRGGKDYGTEIIKTKGYTNFGAAVSAALLIESMVNSGKGHGV